VSDRNLAYYAGRERGGVGTIVIEALHVHPASNTGYNILHARSDAHGPGLARLAQAIKDGGAAAIAQIVHVGRQWHSLNLSPGFRHRLRNTSKHPRHGRALAALSRLD
jgi:2,4-dienoyl-CoA reductase-like NADH-dependent reductase (Old Yellow Enzyme family)